MSKKLTDTTKSTVQSLRRDHVPITVWTEVISATVEGFFPIAPADIPDEPLWDCFGHSETEASAAWILRLCRERGGWVAFTREEIEAVYSRSGKYRHYTFNRLVNHDYTYGAGERKKAGGGWVVFGEDGKYRVTMNFIFRCYESAITNLVPRKEPKAES